MTYYSNKLDILTKLFNTNVLLDGPNLIIGEKIYPIINDVIILDSLISELSKDKEATVTSFGEEWLEFNDIKKSHYNEFNLYFDKLDLKKLDNTLVADFGCGNGRWSYILMEKCSPKNILLFDYSNSIFTARKNLSKYDNAIFIKGDLEKINFKKQIFDFSFCIGVLHHLPYSLKEKNISLSKIVDSSKESLYYLYYNFDGRGKVFKSIYNFSNLIRSFLYPIKSFYIKNIISYILTILFYYPFIIVNRTLNRFSLLSYNLPLYFYTFFSFDRIRQDAYDKFFTPVEHRYSKQDILEIYSKFYSNIVFSDQIPTWHFLAFNTDKSLFQKKEKDKILLITQGYKGGGAQKIMEEILDIKNDFQEIKLLCIDRDNFNNQNHKIEFTGDLKPRNSIFKIINKFKYHNPKIVMSSLTNVDFLVFFLYLIMGYKFKHIIRLSVVLTAHYKQFWIFPLLKIILKFSFKHADKIVCMSDDMIYDLTSNFKVSKQKIIKIENFVEKQNIEINKKEIDNKIYNFICVGRIHHQKGYDILINAIKYIDNKNFRIKIYGWGDSKLLSSLENKINLENLNEFISFEGRCKSFREVVLDVDALIIPSRYEGFPNVVLESLSYGIPVLALPFQGGINEIIVEGLNGNIAINNSPKALAELISNHNSKKYDQDKIINSIKKYNKADILDKYSNLFKNV